MRTNKAELAAPAHELMHPLGYAIKSLQYRWRGIAIAILISLPILSLALSAIMWLKFGVDLPYYDDWTAYWQHRAGIFNLKAFFTPANDTLYPVGMFLDYLAQHFLNGNSVAYQFISMITVQGLLLILQWRLLVLALQDRLLAASAFCLTLLMLQPDGYWGWVNLAYHQAIPLVCILASLYLMLGKPWSNRWGIPALLALGTVSGMTYISGAFSILTVGIVCFISGQFIRSVERKALLWGGLTLIVAGVLTSIPQAWVIVCSQKGICRPDSMPGYPTEVVFWTYTLGMIGRSLMLPATRPVFSLSFSILASVLALAVLVWLSLRTVQGKLQNLQQARTPVVYISLFGVILAYLFMVAFGRTHFGQPPGFNDPLQFFIHGFFRHHFFWTTLIWPWVAAACFQAANGKVFPKLGKASVVMAIVMPLISIPLLIDNGAFNHAGFFRTTMDIRLEGIHCILSKMQRGEPIVCPRIFPYELSEAISFGSAIKTSFMRSLSALPPPVGTLLPAPLFKFSKAAGKDKELINMVAVEQTPEGYRFQAAEDPQIVFRTGSPAVMKSCANLQVSAMLRASEPDVAQLFFKIPGQKHYADTASRSEPLRGDGKWEEISFVIHSQSGFADELRFDPVVKPQAFELRDIEVRCGDPVGK